MLAQKLVGTEALVARVHTTYCSRRARLARSTPAYSRYTAACTQYVLLVVPVDVGRATIDCSEQICQYFGYDVAR